MIALELRRTEEREKEMRNAQNERSSFRSRCRGNTSHINVSFGAVEIAGVRWGNDIKLARSNYRAIEDRDKPAKNSIFPYDISMLFTRCLSR